MSLFVYTVHRLYIRLIAILAVLLLAVGGLMVSGLIPPHHLIMLFDSGVPGAPPLPGHRLGEDREALDFARSAGIDIVVNYSLLNAEPAAISSYLDYAKSIGVKVAPSVKDFFPQSADLDPANQAIHDTYGATNDQRVIAAAAKLEHFPSASAIWGYLIADEPDGSAADIARQIGVRRSQIQQVTSKPTIVAHWNLPAPDLQVICRASDHCMMDYYPYPEGDKTAPGGDHQTYGTIDAITGIARTMAAASDNSCFAIQAFSYYVSEPEKIARFGFPERTTDHNLGAPTTATMVRMAKQALRGGARNLAFFSYGYASDPRFKGQQLENIKQAVWEIRNSLEFG